MASSPVLKLLTLFFKHLVWILGLKPGMGGALKPGRAVEGPSTVSNAVSSYGRLIIVIGTGRNITAGVFNSQQVLTTAVMTDLPVISNILSRLFESSQ